MRELREKTGMSARQFSDFLNIPYRTLQNWEAGSRNCPVYVKELAEYKLRKEGLLIAGEAESNPAGSAEKEAPAEPGKMAAELVLPRPARISRTYQGGAPLSINEIKSYIKELAAQTPEEKKACIATLMQYSEKIKIWYLFIIRLGFPPTERIPACMRLEFDKDFTFTDLLRELETSGIDIRLFTNNRYCKGNPLITEIPEGDQEGE